MKRNQWVWIILFLVFLMAYLSSTLPYLIGSALHVRTLLMGIIPFLVFLPPADCILQRFSSFTAIPPINQWIYRLTLSIALASAFACLLLTFHIAIPLVLYGASVILLFLYWGWWKQTVLFWQFFSNCSENGIIEKALLLLLILTVLAAALLPPLGYDAHEYHLAVPEEYLQQGQWIAFEDNVYAGFPMNVEMLYLWPLTMDSAAGCTVINLVIGFITVLALIALAQQWGMRQGYIVWLALIFFSCPQVLRLIYHANIDLSLSLCAVVLLLAYERFRHERLTLDGVMLVVVIGFALGAKYIAILSILIPFAALTLLDFAVLRNKALLMKSLLIMCAAMLLFLPWLIRNIVLYENPIYPLLTPIFGGDPPIFADVFHAAHSPSMESWARQLLSFFVIPFEKSFGENVITHGFGCLWLLSIPVFFRTKLHHPIFRSILFLGVTYVVWFFVTQRNDRFLSSILPLLAIYPLFAWDTITDPFIRKAMRVVLIIVMGLQVWFGMMVVFRGETVDYIFQSSFQENYFVRRMPHYRAIHYLNQKRAESLRRFGRSKVGKVLFIGEAQTYGAEFETIAPTVFNHHPLEDGTLPDSVTHILYNGSELNRLHKGYGPLGWPLGPVLYQWIEASKGTILEPVYDAIPEDEGTVVVYRVK